MNLCHQKTFSTQYAYVVFNKSKEILESNIIDIDRYLKDECLMSEVNSKIKCLVCKNGHRLTKCQSNTRKSYFKHSNNNDIQYYPTSKWYSEWKQNFENKDVLFKMISGGISDRIADVVIGDYILEFQHSDIIKKDVNERSNDYLLHNKQVHWIIDCGKTIQVCYLELNGSYLIKFLKDKWKYTSFVNQEYIYLNKDNQIFRIKPTDVKSDMVDVGEYKDSDQFITAMKQNINIFNNLELPQCNLYYNQRGAGCGKTYESIQLLNKNDRFQHKKKFIYLTKMHSAKDVIRKEFDD